jgi:16S rRNA (cytosine1402-N4)-methyltransferase
MRLTHTPVLLKEVLDLLNPQGGQAFIDGTVGLGGHAAAIWRHIAPDGRLLAIDRDERNLTLARERLSSCKGIAFAQGSYAEVKNIAYEHGFSSARGILLDLGYASSHIEDSSRGFSFQSEGPLDMRYDARQELTAEKIVNEYNADELAMIFRKYGEEKQAAKIARAIVKAREGERFTTTTQLAKFIESLTPRRGKIHPATKVFQALRIMVNDELGELERALPLMTELLDRGGTLAVISFHSLEDRLVKKFIKNQEARGIGENLTRRVITPTKEEVRSNPRARSAKLRGFRRYDVRSKNKLRNVEQGDG